MTTRFPHAILVLVALLASAGAFAQGDDLPGAAIETASYGLWALPGSDMNPSLQVVERPDGTRFVLTLARPEPGRTYRAVLYEGDCGPDRPLVRALAPTGLGNDPHVSTTDTDLDYATVTRSDWFAYLFVGDEIDRPETVGLDGEALACGEVGADANR